MRPSNMPVHDPPQISTPISQISESDLYLTQGDNPLFGTLQIFCGSVSALNHLH